MDTKGTPTRRYTVTTAPAYLSEDNRRGLHRPVLVGHFARKGEALSEAKEALSAFRVTHSTVSRERFVAKVDPVTGREWQEWEFDGTVKDFSRWLTPAERAD